MKANSIFFGSARKESIAALEILRNDTNVLLCVGKKSNHDALADYCNKNDIPCYFNQEFYALLNEGMIEFKEETLLISFLFQNLIRKDILSVKEIFPINFHPAPLPYYKGCACSCFYLMNKDLDKYGVTAHIVNERFDEGDILKVKYFDANANFDNRKTFNQYTLEKMLELLTEVITDWKLNDLHPYYQDLAAGKYFSKKDLDESKRINLTDPLDVINKKIEAFWFPPYHGANIEINGECFTLVNEKILKESATLYEKNNE